MKDLVHSRWFHPLLLLLWLIVGASLRLIQLDAKPPWTDEFATLVFSLGQSFRGIPLDQTISLETLLSPLRMESRLGIADVIQNLLSEDVHPPLYFVLAHQWMRLFSAENSLISIWVARSLSVLMGVISIPAMFGLGWLAFRSRVVGQLAAAMMAVSPFGIYLAQEARHYTLAILWVIALLCCLVLAVQSVQRRSRMPLWVGLVWVLVNALGIATHYFVLISIAAGAGVILGLALLQAREDRRLLWRPYWRRIYGVACATLITGLVWVPIWLGLRSHETTQWIQSQSSDLNLLTLINPIFQSLAAWITMLVLLPVESPALPVVILAGLAMAVFLVWAVPILVWGLKRQRSHPLSQWSIGALGGFVLAAIALFFLITYGLGTDLTRGARYNFVYFPAVIMLLGVSLAACWKWQPSDPERPRWGLPQLDGKRSVGVVLTIGVLSGLTVVSNLGYQKYYRPEPLISLMQTQSQEPILIATTHNTLVQVGEMMGIGWQFRSELNSAAAPQFLFAHQDVKRCLDDCEATTTLQKTLSALPRPLDLWLVNFHAPSEVEAQNCVTVSHPRPYTSGYSYQLYRCRD